ncbi:MAG: fadR [Ramlibacter sp.]|jgi:TetR/AcrR family fatty acid metabolism transcriptional regulator|nr:fadR [Ramlibacter sp.]
MGDMSGASIHDDYEAREILIFRSALAEFCSKGYERASISSIAASVGVSEALLYKHVKGKQELLYRSIALGYEDELAQALAEIASWGEGGSHTRKLLAFIRAHILGWSRNPGFHLLYFHESRKPKSEYTHLLSEKSRQYFAVLETILQGGARSGDFVASLDFHIACDLIIGGIDQALWWRAEKKAPIVLDAIFPKIAEVFTRALLREPRPLGPDDLGAAGG